jgi:hypothetical protein
MTGVIEHLNTLVADAVTEEIPLRTTEELRAFLKNPPQRTYSIALEEAMTSVVQAFELADEDGRRALASSLSKRARNGLLGYAADMAVLAVRRQSPALIQQGLVALVIEGASQDFRDSIVALARLYHSAVKMGIDPQEAFEKAASLAEPGTVKTILTQFPLRAPKDRGLPAFHLAEEGDGENFRYTQAPWPSPRRTAAVTPDKPVETPQQISARLNSGQQTALINFAGTLAAMAVRTQSPRLVEQGLHGLAAGGGSLDPSQSMAALAKLYHAASKLGMNAEAAFAQGAQFAPPGELRNAMTEFPSREPKERELAAFNLQEEITDKGFGFKTVVPGTDR